MKITFLGAAKTVTGSKYFLKTESGNLLIDCGLYQGYKELRLRNWDKLPVDPRQIDAVVLTHAHIDHTGYLPLLVKNGFKGNIYCTHGTMDLCSILLPDSGYLQEEDANRANRYGYSKHKPALPLYTEQDSRTALLHFKPLQFNKSFQILNNIRLTLLPAGHIIGSSFVCLETNKQKIVFTGDLGRPHHPVMKPPATITDTDYLVIESTYGDRLHDKTNPLDVLSSVIQKTAARGGSIIIPAFAVGRTQDVLYYLYTLKQQNKIPEIPIYLDSPMAQDVSDLLRHYSSEHRLSPEISGQICKIAKYVRTSNDSKLIDQQSFPSIIISASGMLEGGRILHHLKHYLPEERNTIVFTGYQDPGTRGDRIMRGEPQIKIHGEMIPVRAEVASINSMSAHADYEEILEWLSYIKNTPRKIFVTHGDIDSAASLAKKITEKYHWECKIPEYLESDHIIE